MDLYTPLLLSRLLDVRFLYNGIETIPIANYDTNIKGVVEHEVSHPWEKVFGLQECFPSVESARGSYEETVRIAGHGRWSLFNMSDVERANKRIREYRSADRQVLFEISENERLWYWQVVGWEQDGLVAKGTTEAFRESIRDPFRQGVEAGCPNLLTNCRPRVAVHIRNSGAWPDTLEYCVKQRRGAEKIARWLDVPIDIYSEGQERDLERIRSNYVGVSTIIHFNEPTVRSFLEMATSDVLLGGKSSFFLFAGLLSSGLKVTWHDYDTALLEMVKHKRDRMVLDEEWLVVNDELVYKDFMHYFEERRLN